MSETGNYLTVLNRNVPFTFLDITLTAAMWKINYGGSKNRSRESRCEAPVFPVGGNGDLLVEEVWRIVGLWIHFTGKVDKIC